jgi:Arc/MetJ-type ribon-helix-helix transcriptional regulator
MAYYTKQVHVRLDDTKELIKKVDELMAAYPEDFESQSQTIRAAVNFMHKERMKNFEKKNHEVLEAWQT